MKFLLSTFLLLLAFENAFSQSPLKFKGFELVDSVIYKPNEQGITLSNEGNIIAIKIKDRYYFTKHSYPDSLLKFVKALERNNKEKYIRGIYQLGDKTILFNGYGFTVMSPPDYKPVYVKSSFFKDKNGKYIYPDDMMTQCKRYEDKLYFNSMPLLNSLKSLRSLEINNGKSPEVIALGIENNKVKLMNEYGSRNPKNPERLIVPHQVRAYFDIDTLNKRIFMGSYGEPEIEVFSMKGDSLFSFGDEGKFITFDSVISKYSYYREDSYSMRAAATYKYCAINLKENILIRSYQDGVLMNIHPDSLTVPRPKKQKGGQVDLYMNEVYKNTPLPNQGIQIYDLNSTPPKLIADVTGKEFLYGFFYASFDAKGLLTLYRSNYETGILKLYKYKVLLGK
jgi:hypothetical protein